MDGRLDFLVYCIESYKNAKGLKGRETVELFNRYRVFDYIKVSYEALHTTGREYIIEDLNIYINARKRVDAEIMH
ncbi:DUF3791 domain-containing protein [Peptococcaceae bacterium]|nr:DUF3791 domain-containing protein [Peptococcaceae bacterium]